MTRALGYLPDPPKDTDFDFAELGLTAIPAEATLRPFVIDVLDQGNLGSCVANAGLQAVRMSHVRQLIAQVTSPEAAAMLQQNPPALGSRLMAYYLARATHHMTGVDSGTYLRALFEILNKFGFCPEEVWPYIIAEFTRMPPTRAIRAAFDQKSPTTYRRIFSESYERVDDVKRALAAGYPVCFGTDVNRDFVNDNFDPSVPYDPSKGQIEGGHAMLWSGYKNDDFDTLNSWSIRFGVGGYFVAKAELVVAARDLWVVEYAPRYSEAA